MALTLIVSSPVPSHNDSQLIDMVSKGVGTATSSSAVNEALKIVDVKCEPVQQFLEKIHSQFSSIAQLIEQWKDAEDHFSVVRELVHRQWKESETNLKQLDLKTKVLNNKEKEFAVKCKELDATYKSVLAKESEYSRYLQEAESYKQEFESLLKRSGERERELEEIMKLRDQELEVCRLKDQSLSHRELELKEREKKCDGWGHRLQKSEEDFEKRLIKLDCREKELSEKQQNLESKQKKLDEDYNSFKEKESSVLSKLKEESIDPSSTGNTKVHIAMNGMEFLRYLKTRATDFNLNSFHDEVRRDLSSSANPSKLVLDALHGFYPSEVSEKGDQENLEGVRKTCIFLLERFKEMGLKTIPDEDRNRAGSLATSWKRQMKIIHCSDKRYLKIKAFQRLVDSYRLWEQFNKDELLKLDEKACKNSGSDSIPASIIGLKDQIQGIGSNVSVVTSQYSPDLLKHIYELSQKFNKTSPIHSLAYLWEVEINEDFLRAAVKFWDPCNHVFRFGDHELIPFPEEFDALIGMRTTQPAFPLSSYPIHWDDFIGFAPEKFPTLFDDSQSVFITNLLSLITPDLSDYNKRHAINLILMSIYLFPTPAGTISKELLYILAQIKQGKSLGVLVAAQIIESLDQWSRSTQTFFEGSMLLLQIWLRDRLHLSEKYKINSTFTIAQCSERRKLVDRKEGWTMFLNKIQRPDQIRWTVPWWRVPRIKVSGTQFTSLILPSFRGCPQIHPWRAMRQMGKPQIIPPFPLKPFPTTPFSYEEVIDPLKPFFNAPFSYEEVIKRAIDDRKGGESIDVTNILPPDSIVFNDYLAWLKSNKRALEEEPSYGIPFNPRKRFKGYH